jgi:hypothetical protein
MSESLTMTEGVLKVFINNSAALIARIGERISSVYSVVINGCQYYLEAAASPRSGEQIGTLNIRLILAEFDPSDVVMILAEFDRIQCLDESIDQAIAIAIKGVIEPFLKSSSGNQTCDVRVEFRTRVA